MSAAKEPRAALVARALTALVLVLAASTAGCALLSKADLVGTHYFMPEVPRTHTNAAGSAGDRGRQARGDAPQLRLGRVSSGAHLRERIAYRDAALEIGYYEHQRWTERPEIYVRREITRTLFEERRFRRVLGGAAPTLDVEVVAFDELRLPTGRAARVELKVVLYELRAVLFEETLTIDRPVVTRGPAPRIEDFVVTIAIALDEAVEQVATRVAAALAAERAEGGAGGAVPRPLEQQVDPEQRRPTPHRETAAGPR